MFSNIIRLDDNVLRDIFELENMFFSFFENRGLKFLKDIENRIKL